MAKSFMSGKDSRIIEEDEEEKTITTESLGIDESRE